FKCSDCELQFEQKFHLRRHYLYKHTNQYPFACQSCDRQFKDILSFESHKLFHTSGSGYLC
ncbi:hypothetical protein HELRODRAFT_92982, partial [Helobdella robusta]